MLGAPLPLNEPRRLARLRQLEILDSPSEEAYDDLVALASALCGTPIALLSLVDSDRQWFKARQGLGACETGRHESFCGHVVANGDTLVVQDTLKDERFFDNPLVTGLPTIRFYAGFPLVLNHDEVLGTLCVIDTRPRALSAEQMAGMERLARVAAKLLDKRGGLRDIQARSDELHRREGVVNAALRAAGEAMWDWDVAQANVNGGQHHAHLLGWEPQALQTLGRDWISLMHPDDVEPARQRLRAHLKGQTQTYESDYRMRHRDGRWIWVRSRGEIVERNAQGVPTRMLGTVADITQRKNLEQEVHALNARLRTEAEQARALASDKARFLATMAHEIRTPLNSILGAARLALEDRDPQTLRDNLALVHDASRNLAHLVDNILDFSRLDAQAVELELSGVSIRGLTGRMLELFRRQALDKGLEFQVCIDPGVPDLVKADSLRLQQILTNLLGNALKFTPAGSVMLRTRICTLTGSSRLVFEVVDSGIGIEAQRLQALFTPFTQANDSIARRFGGTGLGLVISRQLAQLMGGDVELSCAPGVGTTATVWIPLVGLEAGSVSLSGGPADPAARGAANSATATFALESLLRDLRGLRVLVVDDNTMNLTVMQRMLKRAEMQVRVASQADHALEALATEPVDVVLMDLYMPEVDGAQATQRIRALPAYRDLPVLAVSASVTAEERDYCLRSGMDGFVAKPVRLEDLLAEIRRIARRRNSGGGPPLSF